MTTTAATQEMICRIAASIEALERIALANRQHRLATREIERRLSALQRAQSAFECNDEEKALRHLRQAFDYQDP